MYKYEELSASPNIEVAMPTPCSEIMFWGKKFFINMYIYMHLFICEKLFFLKYTDQTWHWHWNCKIFFFFGWRLTRFGKELFLCSYIYGGGGYSSGILCSYLLLLVSYICRVFTIAASLLLTYIAKLMASGEVT